MWLRLALFAVCAAAELARVVNTISDGNSIFAMMTPASISGGRGLEFVECGNLADAYLLTEEHLNSPVLRPTDRLCSASGRMRIRPLTAGRDAS